MAWTKERKAVYYQANKERLLATSTKWRLDNPEAFKILARRGTKTIKGRYNRSKAAAKKRGKSFELTLSEYEAVILNAICTYCEGPLPNTKGGLDRIDSTLGYTVSNVVPCCRRCNVMLGDLPKEEAFTHMQRMLKVRLQKCTR